MKGTGHCYPKKGSLVTVKINGNLANGNDIPSLDSTETFCLGESDVIPGMITLYLHKFVYGCLILCELLTQFTC